VATNDRLAGKTILVSGVSPNLIGGMAYGLADAGAQVFCADINEQYATACAAAIRRRGGDADAFVCDVTDESLVEATVAAAIARYGKIDGYLHGTALSRPFGLLDMAVEEWRLQLDIILTGAFLFSKHVAKTMIERKIRGSFIYIDSTEGHQGNAGNIAYCTAKSGLFNFARAVAMELAPHGIRANTLTPTGTDATEGLARAAEWNVPWTRSARSIPRPEFSSGAEGVPLGRQPAPSDYAHAAVFLASDEASMITGTDLRVDGGVIARYWRWNPLNAAPAAAEAPQ
jgi:NAD(P)-dependent dehydrogenase (short-subunit alcohol dehydrogenase family)